MWCGGGNDIITEDYPSVRYGGNRVVIGGGGIRPRRFGVDLEQKRVVLSQDDYRESRTALNKGDFVGKKSMFKCDEQILRRGNKFPGQSIWLSSNRYGATFS